MSDQIAAISGASPCESRVADQLVRWLEAGQQALEAGRFADAVTAFGRVHELVPTDVSIAIAHANAHRLNGDMATARSTLQIAHRQGVWTEPSVAFALGAALLDTGAPYEAVSCFEHLVSIMPDSAAGLGALAGARRTIGEPAIAWPLIKRARSLAPADPALLLTAAQIRHDLGDVVGALKWLDRADAVRPNHGPTQLQRAYSTLLRGASREGWRLFDARPLPSPSTRARAWQGEALDGGSLLVTAEQGIGDQFQFARFIPLLHERGAGSVVVECHEEAVSLLQASGFRAVARGAPPDTDWHVPMLSLPHRLQCGDDVRGACVPYLHAPGGSDAEHAELSAIAKPRFGLVWAGNPAFSGRVTRDLDTARLPEILAIQEIHWISLQHGDAGAKPLDGLAHVPLPADWAATATMLRSLDGLVTTDTGIAHLAGAMGVPTWVLLQHVPDWRWGLRGETTPWYPSVRLVRQPRPRDWSAVVALLRNELQSVRT